LKAIAFGSSIACLLAAAVAWAVSQEIRDPTIQQVLAGLFIGGGFMMSIAANIFPKHAACVNYYGARGDFEVEP
jgi:hypothetical protein